MLFRSGRVEVRGGNGRFSVGPHRRQGVLFPKVVPRLLQSGSGFVEVMVGSVRSQAHIEADRNEENRTETKRIEWNRSREVME